MRAKGNKLTLTRIYDAPVKLVWEAWTDPKKAAKWWGPRGFTITTHSKDLRPGGTWEYTMHGPDGTDYPNRTLYYEVVPEKLLEYDHGSNDTQPALFRVRVTFEELKGKTKMVMTMTLKSPEAAKQIEGFIKQAGGNSTWDRLGEYLDKEVQDKEHFIINRVFEAPLATMHQMWTDPKHLSQWLPPVGLTMEYFRAEIAPGKSSFYKMTNGKDVTMLGRIEYKEITPTRIVYVQQFCDENENPTRHPMSPVWPLNMQTVVTFNEEGPNETRVTVVWEPIGDVSSEELEAFRNMKPSMTQGWTGSFDKLEVLLS